MRGRNSCYNKLKIQTGRSRPVTGIECFISDVLETSYKQ